MSQHRHFIIHKPFGYLSQFVNNQKIRRNKKLLNELGDFPEGTMSIGRLDEDSEGLLLLSTDGKVSAHITSKKIEKEYFVQVSGEISTDAVKQIQEGVEISLKGVRYTTLPCKALKLYLLPILAVQTKKVKDERHKPTSWLSITIREGKFRQVRKMTAAVGHPTLRLVRVRIGNIHLSDLKAGEIIEVDNFELNKLNL